MQNHRPPKLRAVTDGVGSTVDVVSVNRPHVFETQSLNSPLSTKIWRTERSIRKPRDKAAAAQWKRHQKAACRRLDQVVRLFPAYSGKVRPAIAPTFFEMDISLSFEDDQKRNAALPASLSAS
jgi:hypothetical protein